MADHLPPEILVEILLRLPSKSILRCTSVCKSWRNLITDPSFISHHLHHSPFPHSLFLRYSENLFTNVHFDLRHSSTLQLPPLNCNFHIVDITHGLFLCADTSRPPHVSLTIVNPSLRRFLILPEPRVLPRDASVLYAFGFVSRNQDYKVVRAVSMSEFDLCAPLDFVEVYSLATGAWKDLTAYAPVCRFYSAYAPSHGFVNGVIHWGAKRKVDEGWYHFVLSFCLDDEVFDEVPLPQSIVLKDDDCSVGGVYVVGGGKDLTVYHVNDYMTYSGDIWVMKEYGVMESWSKVFSSNWTIMERSLEVPSLGIMVNEVMAPPMALCCGRSGEVLFLLIIDDDKGHHLYLLDGERKTFTDLQFGMEGHFRSLYVNYYKESLVLLNKASGMLSY